MTSQIIDTAIFIMGAFYGVVPNIGNMILSQYAIKVIYAALDTIPFYIMTSKSWSRGRVACSSCQKIYQEGKKVL